MAFKEFFDSKTSASSARLMTFIALCAAIVLACVNGFIALYMSMNPIILNSVLMPQSTMVMDSINWLVGILLGYSGGTKVFSKYAEKEITIDAKSESPTNSTNP